MYIPTLIPNWYWIALNAGMSNLEGMMASTDLITISLDISQYVVCGGMRGFCIEICMVCISLSEEVSKPKKIIVYILLFWSLGQHSAVIAIC